MQLTPREIVEYFRHAPLAEVRVTLDFATEAVEGRKRVPKPAEKVKRKRRTKAEMQTQADSAKPAGPGVPPPTLGAAINASARSKDAA
jgi:hypothetical protein